jgi:hypothetical protein
MNIRWRDLIRAAFGPLTGGNILNPNTRQDALERRSAYATLLILGGILGEIGSLFIFAHVDVSVCEKAALIICDALIGVGLVVEYFCILGAIETSGAIKSASEKAVAEANNRLADVEVSNGFLAESTAMAVERAAQAELETQRLKALYAWRRILPEQVTYLRFGLAKMTGGSVIIRWFMYDLESNNLAEDMGAVFKLSGWKVRFSPESYSGNFAYGLRISSPFARTPSDGEENERASKIVKDAFTNSYFDFDSLPSPTPHMMTGARGDDISSPCAELYVGPKRPPSDD